MGTHPIFESDFDCLTESKMGDEEKPKLKLTLKLGELVNEIEDDREKHKEHKKKKKKKHKKKRREEKERKERAEVPPVIEKRKRISKRILSQLSQLIMKFVSELEKFDPQDIF